MNENEVEMAALRNECEALRGRLAEVSVLLDDIYYYAQQWSTGPASPDRLWDIYLMVRDVEAA